MKLAYDIQEENHCSQEQEHKENQDQMETSKFGMNLAVS